MKKYLKIFVLSAKSQLSFSSAVKSFFESSLYFILLVFVFSNASMFSGYSNDKLYFISEIYLLVILLYKYFYENALIVRYLVITDCLERILTKPINPLFRILVEKINMTDMLIGMSVFVGILFFNPSKYLFLVFSGLIISFAIFIIVLSLLLITSGKLPMERILIGLFLIGFLGLAGILNAMLILLFSVFLLVLSIRFWNYALTKYTSASS